MESSDSITFMMSFLKDFNYPLVHSMNYEEMAHVFHISNRCFLICWALKLLDEECYVEVLKDREQDKDLLANLVCNHGFCTEKEKAGFLNGDLSVIEQFLILQRMFKFIRRHKEAAPFESQVPVSLENLQDLLNTNLNIFPTFGDVKTFSKKEKVLKLNQLLKEVDELKVPSEQDLINEPIENNPTNLDETDFQNMVKKLSLNFYEFDRMVKAVNEDKRFKKKSKYEVDPHSGELFAECTKYVKVVSQYIEDLKTIHRCVTKEHQGPKDDISPLIEMLVEQMQTSFNSI